MALVIVEHEQEARWAHDPVMRGRVLELEVEHMADEADRRIGRIQGRLASPGRHDDEQRPGRPERNVTCPQKIK